MVMAWRYGGPRPALNAAGSDAHTLSPDVSNACEHGPGAFSIDPVDARRALDIVISSMALVATSPVLLLACVAMALTMHRKVFFLQKRYGQGGRLFTLIKLRSLKDAPNAIAGRSNESRLTPVARIIRRFGIDELPEFVNVLKGDMSLFGPRPFDVEPDVPGWPTRYEIKPGLIGLASIREKISGVQAPLETVAADDLEYIQKRTWRLDAWLLMIAIACIAAGRIDPQEQNIQSGRLQLILGWLSAVMLDHQFYP